ncbi:MAG: DUF6587 family protein [Rhodanobacteraceae bacterium]
MSAGLLIQYVLIGMAVLASALMVFRKLAPQLTNRWLAAASIRLARPGRSRFARALGRRLRPKQATGNCADGCASCGACGSKKPAAAQARAAHPPGSAPLHFRPRVS